MNTSPIILFVYNRPNHTFKTLEALQKNEFAEKSILYIYSDGPKEAATQQDLDRISEVRSIIRLHKWCKEVYIIEREKNWGLADNIIDGVTKIVNEYGRVIVLEDDLITSPYFLGFMNDALEVYKEEKKVISIGANTFFAGNKKLPETFFIPIPDCWGWATWKDRWDLFERDSQKLIQGLKKADLVNTFNLEGAYDFFGMLEAQALGKVNSWAIRWQAVAYLNNMLSLYPQNTLTKNIGFGEGATHTTSSSSSSQDKLFLADKPIFVRWQKPQVRRAVYRQMRRGYRLNFQSSGKAFAKIKKLIKLLLPTILLSVLKQTFNTKNHIDKRNNLMWEGNYTSWEAAIQYADGYTKPQILEKVRAAILKVKAGKAAYERDSVVFEKPQYPWPLIALLLQISTRYGNTLHVIDFGGSLGSTYFSCRTFLDGLTQWSWSVVEQEHFVTCGQKEIADERLQFFYTIEDALKENYGVKVLLLSSVLQYLPDPYAWLHRFLDMGFEYILLDRTAFIQQGGDRLTLQYVPPAIYEAIYPAWFFCEEKLRTAITDNEYCIVNDFDNGFTSPQILEDSIRIYWKGFILKKCKS